VLGVGPTPTSFDASMAKCEGEAMGCMDADVARLNEEGAADVGKPSLKCEVHTKHHLRLHTNLEEVEKQIDPAGVPSLLHGRIFNLEVLELCFCGRAASNLYNHIPKGVLNFREGFRSLIAQRIQHLLGV
jgi:hypothetical protein